MTEPDDLFPNYDYPFQPTIARKPLPTSSSTLATQIPKPKPLHIRFGNLPKPDRSSISRLFSRFNLLPTAFGTIAQRRVQKKDEWRYEYFADWTEYWSRKHPDMKNPVFREIIWDEDPHPGRKVDVDVLGRDLDDVSPKTWVYVPVVAPALARREESSRVEGAGEAADKKRSGRRLRKKACELARGEDDRGEKQSERSMCVVQDLLYLFTSHLFRRPDCERSLHSSPSELQSQTPTGPRPQIWDSAMSQHLFPPPTPLSPGAIDSPFNPFLVPPRTYSSISSDSSSSSGSSDSSESVTLQPKVSILSKPNLESTRKPFVMGLLINGTIGQRRFEKRLDPQLRGEAVQADTPSIGTMALHQAPHGYDGAFESRGAWAEQGASAKIVRYDSHVQPQSARARDEDGEAVRPRAIPVGKQRTREERVRAKSPFPPRRAQRTLAEELADAEALEAYWDEVDAAPEAMIVDEDAFPMLPKSRKAARARGRKKFYHELQDPPEDLMFDLEVMNAGIEKVGFAERIGTWIDGVMGALNTTLHNGLNFMYSEPDSQRRSEP